MSFYTTEKQVNLLSKVSKTDLLCFFFLSLLGIGVDDMFIIIQALETLDDEQQKAPIHIKMGHVLKRAGVSITVTSLTDVAAFAIGATTVCDEYIQLSVGFFLTVAFQGLTFRISLRSSIFESRCLNVNVSVFSHYTDFASFAIILRLLRNKCHRNLHTPVNSICCYCVFGSQTILEQKRCLLLLF